MNKEASIQSHQAKKTRLGLVILILLIINYGVVSLSLLASTQFTAHQLNYSDDLGQPLYGRIYNPSHYFTWLSQNHTLTNDAAIRSISLGIFIAPSALCLLISISIFLKVLKKRKLMHANNDHPPPAASYESAPPQHVSPDPTPIIEIAEEPDSPFITENTAGTDALPLSEQDSEALTLADIPGVIAVTRFDQEGSVVAHQQHEPARTPENLEFAETVEETQVALCLGSNLIGNNDWRRPSTIPQLEGLLVTSRAI